ncbi:MAG: HK97 gp10 family phage protein [bacterium]|nr:HK97 gp10 family phage protein [bacterium]
MPIVATRGGPLVFGPSKPGVLKKPRIILETKLVEKAMAAVVPELLTQFSRALDKIAEEAVTNVMDATPVQTGDLQGSARRTKVSKGKTTSMVTIKSGGIEGEVRGRPIEYAIVVHQLGSPRGRGRFYVINPVMAVAEAYLPRTADRALERAVNKVKAPRLVR